MCFPKNKILKNWKLIYKQKEKNNKVKLLPKTGDSNLSRITLSAKEILRALLSRAIISREFIFLFLHVPSFLQISLQTCFLCEVFPDTEPIHSVRAIILCPFYLTYRLHQINGNISKSDFFSSSFVWISWSQTLSLILPTYLENACSLYTFC